MIAFYNALWVFILPIVRYRLRYKGKKNPAYKAHREERFFSPAIAPVQHAFWLHAVSLGETRAAESFITLMRKKYPEVPWLITTMTPAGREEAVKRYSFAQCRYLPYDKRKYVLQFLASHRPQAAFFMETEVWPNFVLCSKHRKIPLFLINARLEEGSFLRYRRFLSLFKPVFAAFTYIFAQGEQDKKRFAALGAERVGVFGNIKYDKPFHGPNPVLKKLFQVVKSAYRPIVVVGSTRVDKAGVNEAFLLLKAWQPYKKAALLVIVPRHVEAFAAVYEEAHRLGYVVARRSSGEIIKSNTEVLIGDSLGELMGYYQEADVAFVGGSLVATGCQNIIEPLSLGIPTLFGFSTYNFLDATAAALSFGAALQVTTSDEWAKTTIALLRNPLKRKTMAENSHRFMAAHRGATAHIVDKIGEMLHFG